MNTYDKKKKMKHVMIPFRPHDVFYRAFESALNIAKQNKALLSLVKVIHYPAGIGLDTFLVMDMVSREYDLSKFDKIVTNLQKDAITAKVKLDVHVLDMHLSPAKAFVEFASKNDVDLMVMGKITSKGWNKHFDSDISDEIMDLNPQCNVILVE